ncbi:MAG: NAD(P)/FAD-dependent oxidoreductase [Helicobacteraceae bacterium]|jgi:predicted Rossmann fold flavoprotein|nr:NAD(P)/FAD-dependent oxidoreductase [Helicobacteraceae bacterium]
MNKIAIVGGGAAGLMAAITAAKAGADVTVYEHNKSVGKKILASGNGRCNIINTTAYVSDYFGADPDFADYALKSIPFNAFEKFCHSIGLLLDAKDDGRCYPLSNEAKSVVIAFTEAVKEAGVTIFAEDNVTNITQEKEQFVVESSLSKKKYDRVLIATGSEAAPQLGATGDGYDFAKSFGHTIEAPYPSLVQLHIDSEVHHKMAGVKTVADVTLYLNGKPEEKIKGDILFTNYGISGLAILDISQKASSALIEFQHVSVGLNILPQFNRQALSSLLEKLLTAVPHHTLETALSGVISTKIVPHLLKSAKIEPTLPASALNTKQIKKLAHQLQDWRFEITDTHGFKHAEVSGGGISTTQINEKTMESKLVAGLFFAGEVIDIVGRRGGYNFNFAWASGMLAGKAMA